MPFKLELLTVTNIVIVYEALDVAALSRDAARRLIGGNSARLVDGGDVLIVDYPTEAIQFVFAHRRMQINDNKPVSLSESRLPKLIKEAQKLTKGIRIVAYGFNFDAFITLPDQKKPKEFLKARFLANRKELTQQLSANIEEIALQFKLTEKDLEYNLDLKADKLPLGKGVAEPHVISGIHVHFNAHYPKREVPSSTELKKQLEGQFKYLLQLLGKLFKD